jgi:hypothetical protein
MGTMRYPVLREQALDRAQRRMLQRSRDMKELPSVEPGTVMVFEIDSGYVAYTDRRHLVGREDIVVNAVSISVVDVRPRTLTVPLTIPSRSAADDFTVLVDFDCRVEDPERVAELGLTDLTTPLRAYLRQDAALGQLAASRSIEQIAIVRDDVAARISAYAALRRPHVEGVAVSVSGIRVLTPKDLAQHERDMRDESWRQQRQSLQNRGEDRNADRLRGYFEQGPAAVAGLATSRGELNLQQATDREYETLAAKRADLIRLFDSLPEGLRDTIAIDGERIINSVFDEILGPAKEKMSVEVIDQSGRGIGSGERLGNADS